jgi:hypothetical protein
VTVQQEYLNFRGRARLPVMLQTEAAECGIACLAMIASYFGHRIDLDTLRRRHPVSLKGMTLEPSSRQRVIWSWRAGRCTSSSRISASCGCRRSCTGT